MSVSPSDPTPDYGGPEPAPASQSLPVGPQPGGASGVRCETCGAAVELDQRYCVECGAHRVGVNDPAASFMNRAPVRSQRATRAVVVSSRRSRLISALVLALIPVAVAVGLLVGRSSNNQDPNLIKALKQSRAQVVTVQSGSAQVVTVGASGKVTKSSTSSKTKASKSTSTAKKTSAAVGSKESATQQKSSASIVKKLNNTTGQSYLDPITSQVGGG